ncbi:MAG: Uncharacterised protein [Marine Group II euryarchaeote MED-G33]|nr:MAG: Uncharacterised protein [Marine Group II euryarchaeote MED-G33]
MILAYGLIFSRICWAHASASPSVRFGPPMTLTNAPRASLTSMSRSGLSNASNVASWARSGPLASPRPIIAIPPPLSITERRSSKSRFTRPSLVTNSVTPAILRMSSSSATLNAAPIGRSLTPSTESNFSLGRTTTVSQTSRRRSKPHSAFCRRKVPSDSKG